MKIEVLKKYHELDLVDRTIMNIVEKLEGEIAPADVAVVRTASSIQEGIKLQEYRSKIAGMNPQALRKEEHSSVRLGDHLVEKFGRRPNNCHAHAIVSGKHPLSAQARLLMAKLKVQIDDVDNGCWLPDSSKHCPHPAMPSAPPHSRIHRYNYYFWLSSRLNGLRETKVFRNNLKVIAQLLYTGKMPDYVMLKKGVGIPR